MDTQRDGPVRTWGGDGSAGRERGFEDQPVSTGTSAAAVGTRRVERTVHALCTLPGEQTRPARERGRPDAQRQTAWAPARGRQSPHRARTARCAHEDTFLDFECHECAFSLKHRGLEQQAPGLNSFCDCRRTVR